MGEVYRALDTRLNRTVAIKVAREEFSDRFEREARAVAALNHPHIGQLYDVGPNYLVMEFVDGLPIAGPLPLAHALTYTTQICEALDAAHRAGIVHRDLKPSNILTTKNGIKLLDFGLAKSSAAVAADTETVNATRAGTILGTPHYMSPEQAQGRPADARSDIFALGLVLYELVTGRRAFEESSAAAAMAAVIERPAPALEPPAINRIVATCLAKNPDDRFQTARDLKRAIEWAQLPIDAPHVSRAWIGWAAALAAAIALAAAGWWRAAPAAGSVTTMPTTLTIAPPAATGIWRAGEIRGLPLISPDGRTVAYRDAKNTARLRDLDTLADKPLPGTELAQHLAWSPDSKWLGFDVGNELRRLRVDSGISEPVTRISEPVLGLALGDNGSMLLGGIRSMSFVASPGSEPAPFVLPGAGAGLYSWPQFVAGTDDFLVTFQADGATSKQTYRARMKDGRVTEAVQLLSNATAALYTPAGGGRLLFVRESVLFSQRLSPDGRQLRGDAESVARGVASNPSFFRSDFSVSANGVVVWRPGREGGVQLTTFDRGGHVTGTSGPPSGGIMSVRLAPDEQHLLVTDTSEQWLMEPGQPGRLTLSRNRAWLTAIWANDSTRLLMAQNGRLLEVAVSNAGITGTEREIATAPGLNNLDDVSADGTVLFYPTAPAVLVSALPITGTASSRMPTVVLQSAEGVSNARFSPDARWIVFDVPASPGQPGGIFVRPFPGSGARRQLAQAGSYPTWRRDGKEIVFLSQQKVWSIRVAGAGETATFSPPEPLFDVGPHAGVIDISVLAVSRDGSRFFLPQAVPQPGSDLIHVRTGWLKD